MEEEIIKQIMDLTGKQLLSPFDLFTIRSTMQNIENYINQKIPVAAKFLAIKICLDALLLNDTETPNGDITSIKEGDIQLSYSTTATGADNESFLNNYRAQLNDFRKLRI